MFCLNAVFYCIIYVGVDLFGYLWIVLPVRG